VTSLHGLGDNDLLFGNTGMDTINGGSGSDQMFGGTQFDTCNGGPNADTAVACESVSSVP
jgi:Ca2+-binding RTX toxin-like protein